MVFYNDVMFSEQECLDIINLADVFEDSKLDILIGSKKYGSEVDYKKRKSIQSKKLATVGSLVYDRISNIINSFGYELIVDSFNYDIIKYSEGSFLYKHKDGDGYSLRVLSIIGQLSSDTDYEGGDLKFWEGDDEKVLNRTKGMGIIFKHNVYHEVTTVTSGERISFVCFLETIHVRKKGNQSLF
jgi:predicted 2-oxoglutarate/Fe(II)-dependent dioxygenase YbiX